MSELKARLSAYLAAVRGGETVIVCDRSTPIAQLVPYDDVQSFRVEEPRHARYDLHDLPRVRLRRRVDVVRLLRESRDQR